MLRVCLLPSRSHQLLKYNWHIIATSANPSISDFPFRVREFTCTDSTAPHLGYDINTSARKAEYAFGISSAVRESFKPSRLTPGIIMALSAISDEFNSTATLMGFFNAYGFMTAPRFNFFITPRAAFSINL